ncbi:glycosyltransferase involved in cell wall biosynthesis [Undibacterium sp. GrIS 1.8]|uniref:glycosyltransferase n=1 Tax=Undibacterium sp. GrIS 1.8 TaxID=3143934 RepID=UPI003396791B
MLKHGVDHVLIRENQIFAYGWGFVPGLNIRKVVLVLHFDRIKANIELDANYGQRRDDVRKKYHVIPEASDAGFLLLAETGEQKISSIELRWELSDNSILTTPVHFTQRQEHENALSKVAHYAVLAKKSLLLLKNSGPKAVVDKILRYNSGKPKALDSVIWKKLIHQLKSRPCAVVIDHDMGGGANIYRQRHIAERLASDENVLMLGFHIASLQYFVEFFDGRSPIRYSITSIEAFVYLLGHAKIHHILYNCAVSFRQPLSVIKMLVTLRKHMHCELQVVVHDYFAICPSHFLINDKGTFCDVPGINECQRCINEHTDGFVSVSNIRDIRQWRLAWSALLIASDEVRLFSEASKRLLQRAYPDVPQNNWRVQPHALHTSVKRISISHSKELHIGVVGMIGKHKGAEIVNGLAREIQKRHSNIKITIIGAIEARVPSHIVDITGPYHPKQLSRIVQESGANVFLLPSIWAETFSYVSHELVDMGVPFACFNFGAPADLAKAYENGLVLSSMQPAAILDELQCFWRQIALKKKEVIWLSALA